MDFHLNIIQRAKILLLIWVLGFSYFFLTTPIEPVTVFIDNQNTPDQGKITAEQFRNLEFSLWVTLPITYCFFELFVWLLVSDKTGWNLEKYPKLAVNLLLANKLPILFIFLVIFLPTFFSYGFLVGAMTFPLVLVGLWKI